jgi:hypothetical protein
MAGEDYDALFIPPAELLAVCSDEALAARRRWGRDPTFLFSFCWRESAPVIRDALFDTARCWDRSLARLHTDFQLNQLPLGRHAFQYLRANDETRMGLLTHIKSKIEEAEGLQCQVDKENDAFTVSWEM